MKDYYKILGVKNTASEDFIRMRWIELARKYHPDSPWEGGEGGAGEGRIREINEAYQVLKSFPMRAEYDLERALHQKKRRLTLRRLSIRAVIPIALLLLGLIYSMTLPAGKPVRPPARPASREARSALPSAATAGPTVLQDKSGTKASAKESPEAMRSSSGTRSSRTETAPHRKEAAAKGRTAPVAYTIGPIAGKTESYAGGNDAQTPEPTIRELAVNETPRTIQPNPEVPKAKGNQAQGSDQLITTVQTRVAPIEADVPSARIDPAVQKEGNPLTQTIRPVAVVTQEPALPNDPVEPAPSLVHRSGVIPPRPMATEEEVRGFFSRYIDRYSLKDLDGLLSLFSPKAVQNGQHGLGSIRNIYREFFDQSLEVRYFLEDMKIEIRQDIVEIKARYGLVQALKKASAMKVWRGNIMWILTREQGALKILSLQYQQQKAS